MEQINGRDRRAMAVAREKEKNARIKLGKWRAQRANNKQRRIDKIEARGSLDSERKRKAKSS